MARAISTNCTISGNTAYGDGGGIVNQSGSVTLTNCTVSGNGATGRGLGGGGLDNRSGTGTLTDCTISGNTGSFGAGGGV